MDSIIRNIVYVVKSKLDMQKVIIREMDIDFEEITIRLIGAPKWNRRENTGEAILKR